MAAKQFRIVPAGPSREVQETIAELKGRLRRGDIRAIAVVLVAPRGDVTTAFVGHRDGHFDALSSGITALRARFDREIA